MMAGAHHAPSEARLYARRRRKRTASHVLVAEATIAAFAFALASDVAVGIASQRRTGMPRILVDGHQKPWFSVERTVGRNAPNDRLDVLLVQLLLFHATKSEIKVLPLRVPRGLRVATPAAGAQTPARPRPQGRIVIDGFCGDQTIGFIEYFQAEMVLGLYQGVEINGQVARMETRVTTMEMLHIYGTGEFASPFLLGQSNAFPQELRNFIYV